MSVVYAWRVEGLSKDPSTGAVEMVHWCCHGNKDGQYDSVEHGATNHTPDPSSADFTPFSDLTETQVLDWVYGLVSKDNIEAAIAKKIANMESPTLEISYPFSG